MFARTPLLARVPFALLFVLASAAWAPPEPPSPSHTEAVSAAAATKLGAEIVISERSAPEYAPAIAYNSVHNQYLVVWEIAWSNEYHDVYAQRLDGSGKLLSWFSLASPSSHSQINPAVAYDSVLDRYLVVWAYDVTGLGTDWDVYGAFIPWNGPQGAVTHFPICAWTSNQGHPAVAYGRSQEEFLVVWRNQAAGVPGYISGRRIFAGGGFPPGDGFTISSGTEIRDFPDVAYNLARNEYLVTWDMQLTASNIDIYGKRLDGSGNTLTGGSSGVLGEFGIAGWQSNEGKPAVAACAAADQYLLAWESDQGPPVDNNYAIYARYLTGGAVPGSVYKIDDTTSPEINVDIGCNWGGNRYFLAWQSRYTNLEYGIWARTAYPDQTLEPQFAIRDPGSSTSREYPAVAGGRTGFLVAWEHERDSDGNRDIHGRLVQYAVRLPMVLR